MDFDATEQVNALAKLPPEPVKPEKRSAWNLVHTIPRAAVAESAAGAIEIGVMGARSLAQIRDATPEQRKQIDAEGVSGVSGKNDVSASLRNVAEDLRPDPATASKAEQIVFDLGRIVTKAIGYGVTLGPGAIPALAADEGLSEVDRLQRQGVDDATARDAGGVNAAATALGALIPVAGAGRGFTAANVGKVVGLAAASGPTTFMAQQKITSEILSRANYGDIAAQYDPLDPTGLALSTLAPLIFGGLHLRGGKVSAKAEPVHETAPVDQTPAAPKVADMPPEVVDAAMVHNLTLQQDVHEAATAARIEHADPIQAAIDATPTDHAIGGLETREVPVKAITLSEDVPQFKSDANAAGVVEPLGGSFDRTGVAPIQLWERTDGRLEVISGRHRLDLAQRSGEETIPAQVHREADGFDARRASALDAELNIRDGQGKVRDYVDYFQATRIDRATAEQRGLLARSIGKRAFTIANDGSPELVAAHRAGIVTDEAAVAISGAAPRDGRLQAVGIRAVQDGKTIGQAANTVRAVKLLAGERADTTGDMFGFDDSAMREAEQMAKIATAKQREIQTRLSAISGAAKRPELAKAEGINIKDSAAVLRRVEALRAESAAWDNWTTNPDLIEAIRAEIHPYGAPLLQSHSAADLEAKTAREANAPALDEKAQIDAEAEHFQLVQQAIEGRADSTVDMFDAHMRSVTDRVAAVEAAKPDAPVAIDAEGKRISTAEELDRARLEAAEGTDFELGALDADLLRIAADCALTLG